MFIYLVYPVLVAHAAGATPEVASSMVSFTLLAMAVGTVLQVSALPADRLRLPVPGLRRAWWQRGALDAGGAAWRAVGSVRHDDRGRAGRDDHKRASLPHLRKLFTPEITGLVVLLSGISVGALVGLRTAVGTTRPMPAARLRAST